MVGGLHYMQGAPMALGPVGSYSGNGVWAKQASSRVTGEGGGGSEGPGGSKSRTATGDGTGSGESGERKAGSGEEDPYAIAPEVCAGCLSGPVLGTPFVTGCRDRQRGMGG